MANNATFCIDNSGTAIDFSGQSINPGSFISATFGTDPDPIVNVYECFEVYDSDQPGASYTATTNTYTSCYDCLVNNFTLVTLVDCETSSVNPKLDISQFGFIPVIGSVYNLTMTFPLESRFSGTPNGCYTIDSIGQYSEDEYTRIYEPDLGVINQINYSNFSIENGCNECLYGFSAGTDYTTCQVCCPCESGSTITEVITPHPTWTNGFGQSVVQLNAVTLGGPNGLNS